MVTQKRLSMKVEFIKADKVNRVTYSKGDTLNVSASIRNKLVKDNKTAKDVKVKPKKSIDKDD